MLLSRCLMVATFAAVSLLSSRSFAEDGQIQVRIRTTDETLKYDITDVDRGDAFVARCENRCVINMPPGKYRLRLYDRNGELSSQKVVKARTSGNWVVTPGNSGNRTTGLVLGIVGSAVYAVSTLVVVSTAMGSLMGPGECSEGDCSDNDDERKTALFYGLGGMAVGGATAAIGWVMFATNGTRVKVHERPFESGRSPSRLRVGVAPNLKGGAQASLSFAF